MNKETNIALPFTMTFSGIIVVILIVTILWYIRKLKKVECCPLCDSLLRVKDGTITRFKERITISQTGFCPNCKVYFGRTYAIWKRTGSYFFSAWRAYCS